MPAMQLNPDGTITIDFAEVKVRVKAPTIGQYRRIRETIAGLDEERTAEVEKWRVEAGIPEPFPDDATAEQRAALSRVIRQSVTFNEQALLDIWHLILIGEATGDKPFKPLAIDALPTVETDEWPIELLSPLSYNQAMDHWAAVPLRSGGTPAPETTEPLL